MYTQVNNLTKNVERIIDMIDATRIRTAMLLGEEAVSALVKKRAAVAGLGGVGSFAVEALVRAGVGFLTLIDDDTVDASNINRQIQASPGVVGQMKAEVLAARVASVRPDTGVSVVFERISPETAAALIPEDTDFILDCVDDVKAKVALVLLAKERKTPIISALGMGNRLDPQRIKLCDIYETKGCPLAQKLRYELRKAGVDSLRVAFSDEPPVPVQGEAAGGGKRTVGSVSFVPSVCGLSMAGAAVREMCSLE